MQFDLNATGDGYDTEVISEALGKMHYSEIYTDEGMHLVSFNMHMIGKMGDGWGQGDPDLG
jgi:hypothetical protein